MDVSYPRHWEEPHNKFRLVKLDQSSEEYKRVAKLAVDQQYEASEKKNTFVKGKLKVTGVSRVQSPSIWEAYRMRRAIVAAENNGDANERFLWHGTKVTDTVVRKGLDPRVCSLNGLFGGGVYFADLSTKSVRYTGSSQKGNCGQLLLCRVALGRQMKVYFSSLYTRRPPDPWPLYPSQTLDWWNDNHYHSLFAPAGFNLLMNEYIVYHSNQGIPEYVIDFALV